MSVHYDALAINRNIGLDLPFREGVGAITHSIAKTHPLVTMVGAPAPWSTLASHLPFLTLSGVNEYLWATAADTAHLDFTSEDYSLGGWFRLDSGGPDDKTLACRFRVSTTGWELYHYTNEILTLRHHHASQGVGNERTSAFSRNWAFGKWWFMGVSRHGDAAQFWRGDIDSFGIITTTVQVGGLVNPDTCPENLFIGTDLTGINDYKGGLWRPRAWFDRYLTEADWKGIWKKEVHWFRS